MKSRKKTKPAKFDFGKHFWSDLKNHYFRFRAQRMYYTEKNITRRFANKLSPSNGLPF